MFEFARDNNFSQDYNLYWLARVGLVLPLPPLWEEEINALGNKVYTNAELNYPYPDAPYSSFLLKFIHKARLVNKNLEEKFMTFYDKNSIRYVVDITKIASRKDYIILRDSIPDPEFKKKALYFKPQLTSDEALTDIMIFEIAQSIGIDLNKELHLISAVYQIIEMLKSENILKNWDFRITKEGTRYWYNSKEKRSVNSFPYKDEIKKYVRVAKKEAFTNAKNTIRSFQERHPEFVSRGKDFFEKCRKEALSLTEVFIKNLLGVILT